MPLDKFRERQKLIYWIVAIVVIPSFIFFFGASGSMWRDAHGEAILAKIDGQKISRDEFAGWRERLAAVTGRPRIYLFPPEQDPDGSFSLAFTMLYRRDAEAAGLNVSEREIGAFIRDRRDFQGPTGGFDQETYARFLKVHRLTHADFVRGVRDWLIIRKFVELIDGTAAAGENLAYVDYAAQRSKCSYKTVAVKAEAFEKTAQDQLSAAFEGAAAGDAAFEKHIEQYLAAKQDDKRFWSQAKWRFEYVLAPYENSALEPEIADEEIEPYFQRHKADYGERKLDEVRPEIKAAIIKEKRGDIARLTIQDPVESYLTRCLAENRPIETAQLVQDPLMQKRGVKVGVSGEAALPIAADTAVPGLGASAELAAWLAALDGQPAAKRDKRIEELRKNFDQANPPLTCAQGVLRLRLLDYVPGEPRQLRNEKGELDRALRLQVADILVKEKSRELAEDQCRELMAKIRDRQEKLEKVEPKREDFNQIPTELRFAPMGDPRYRSTDEGFEVLVLTKREVPSREVFAQESPTVRSAASERAETNLRGVPQFMQYGFLRPGAHLSGWNQEALNRNRVELLWTRNASHEEE